MLQLQGPHGKDAAVWRVREFMAETISLTEENMLGIYDMYVSRGGQQVRAGSCLCT